MAEFIPVATVDEVPPGGKKVVLVEGQPIALVNLDGTIYAFQDVCTHDGGPLAQGRIVGEEIECPRHGARFSIRTGQVTRLPACEPIETYSVRVEGKMILLCLDE
jgi:3-phenylpropionate/trans-cinnamate dioxygenase ferredoxin subunit